MATIGRSCDRCQDRCKRRAWCGANEFKRLAQRIRAIGKSCRAVWQNWPLERKGPARGDGQGQGSSAEASDLSGGGNKAAVEATIGLRAGLWQSPNWKCCHADDAANIIAKKRGSNRSWSLMIGPKPNLK